MSTPKERTGAVPTIAPGIYRHADGRYLVRVTFSPLGDFYEASDYAEDYQSAVAMRSTLRQRLIERVAPVEVSDPTGQNIGVVYNLKIAPLRPLRPVKSLPPKSLFKDEE